ncbi:hypothetical protein K490DRAFT_64143 [Saccharata proteae CBS 121410]|uniref:Thioester reductase (TE) domain-containing protein n=1 Tax=Saccharata proteae CBS 121410 TaxID=1314787 RepID=A0A6A5YB30_9PEZI|nr:hypothetical protein K490DRAFT_64143 [Saccharata proteae CBS 121410]
MDDKTSETVARALVRKYSQFAEPNQGTLAAPSKECVLLTGATGALGCHILFALLEREDVEKVYCLVRAVDNQLALHRVKDALRNARLFDRLNDDQLGKIAALSSDLGDEHLGLSQQSYQCVLDSTTSIIHNAWTVNFNRTLESFEAQSIRGLWSLLNVALRSPLRGKPALTFISSIGSVMKSKEKPITETRQGFENANPMGYSQSKWVAEEICRAASDQCGLATRILRVGQAVGDTRHGIWNPKEAFPHLFRSALTIGALPVIDGDRDLFWLPVDTCAVVIVEMSLLDKMPADSKLETCSIFHITNPRSVSWNGEVLPWLKRAGLDFEAVRQTEWVRRLEESDPDTTLNPPWKLLNYFRVNYGTVGYPLRRVFDSTQAQKYSPSLRAAKAVDEELVGKFLRFWREEGWRKSSPSKALARM